MRRFLRLVLICVVGAATASCGNDNGTGSTNNSPNVVGTWHATQVHVAATANSARFEEFVSEGLTSTVVFAANKALTISSAWPGQAPLVSTGTYSVTATQLIMTITSQAPTIVYTFSSSLTGNTLTLTGASLVYDFGSGAESAEFNLTLVKP